MGVTNPCWLRSPSGLIKTSSLQWCPPRGTALPSPLIRHLPYANCGAGPLLGTAMKVESAAGKPLPVWYRKHTVRVHHTSPRSLHPRSPSSDRATHLLQDRPSLLAFWKGASWGGQGSNRNNHLKLLPCARYRTRHYIYVSLNWHFQEEKRWVFFSNWKSHPPGWLPRLLG